MFGDKETYKKLGATRSRYPLRGPTWTMGDDITSKQVNLTQHLKFIKGPTCARDVIARAVRGVQVPGGSSSQLQPTIFASAMKRISKSMFASKT